MPYFTKNRIKSFLILFLLITNIATISSILFHRSKFKEQISKDTHYRIKKFIENDLKFTPEQNERYLAAKKDLDAQRPLMYTRFDQHRIAIYKELAQPQIDSVKIDSLTLLMGPHFAQMNKLSIKKYYTLFQICDSTQKAKLHTFFSKLADDISKEMEEKNCQLKEK